jgi:hypothetical protein
MFVAYNFICENSKHIDEISNEDLLWKLYSESNFGCYWPNIIHHSHIQLSCYAVLLNKSRLLQKIYVTFI